MKLEKKATTYYTLEQIESFIKCYGCREIHKGMYLYSAERMIYDQKFWDESDIRKNKDFSTHKFWVTTDDNLNSDGFDSVREGLDRNWYHIND